MKKTMLIGASAVIAAFAIFMGAVLAAEGRKEAVKPPEGHPLDELWSGYYFALPTTNGMQDDDFQNPGMTWYDVGETLWSEKDGKAGKACSECHKKADMKGVGARYPIYYEPWKKLINTENRINLCREKFIPFSIDYTELKIGTREHGRLRRDKQDCIVGLDRPRQFTFISQSLGITDKFV